MNYEDDDKERNLYSNIRASMYYLPPDGANDDATFVVGIGVADTGVVEIGIEDMPATPDMDADTAGEAAGAGFATAVPMN